MEKRELEKLRQDVGCVMKIALCDIPKHVNGLNLITKLTDGEQLALLTVLEVRMEDVKGKCDEIVASIQSFRDRVLSDVREEMPETPILTLEERKLTEQECIHPHNRIHQLTDKNKVRCAACGKEVDKAEDFYTPREAKDDS